MTESTPVAQPFLDWFGIWAGHAGRDEALRAWLLDPPEGIHLRVQQARPSPSFSAGSGPGNPAL